MHRYPDKQASVIIIELTGAFRCSGTILQWWKMREWKHRHGPAGVENAGVEVIELQQDNL